jgi:DDE superfamily endonuclease
VQGVCDIYAQAQELAKNGERVLCNDELTGVQALERLAPGLPLAPGHVQRQEFEYLRHGTLSLIASRDVVTGKVIAPSIGQTRNEQDYAAHIRGVIATDPAARQWHFVVDNLNIHQSESLVRLVAKLSGIEESELGEKGKGGILQNMSSRQAFLTESEHKVVFHYTPKHASWLNQIEIWFSILTRKLLKRASFKSLEELAERLVQFIGYYNHTMAKPFAWTYKGRVLCA